MTKWNVSQKCKAGLILENPLMEYIILTEWRKKGMYENTYN